MNVLLDRFRITETNRSRSEFGLWLLSFLWTGVSLWRTRPRPLSLLCLRLLPFSLLSEVKRPFFRGGCEASASGVADGEKSSDAAEHRGGGGGVGVVAPSRPPSPAAALYACLSLESTFSLQQPHHTHTSPGTAPSSGWGRGGRLGGGGRGWRVEGFRWRGTADSY